MEFELKHIVMIYSSKLMKAGYEVDLRYGYYKFEIKNQKCLTNLMKSLKTTEENFLDQLKNWGLKEAYYPEYNISPLTCGVKGEIESFQNGYYEMKSELFQGIEYELLTWMLPLFETIWPNIKFWPGTFYCPHCPLPIYEDILRLIILICDQSGNWAKSGETNRDFWASISEADISDPGVLKKICEKIVDNKTGLYSLRLFRERRTPILWNIKRRYYHYLWKKFDIHPETGQLRGFLALLVQQLTLGLRGQTYEQLVKWIKKYEGKDERYLKEMLKFLIQKDYIICNSGKFYSVI